jgi:hypothetical protein
MLRLSGKSYTLTLTYKLNPSNFQLWEFLTCYTSYDPNYRQTAEAGQGRFPVTLAKLSFKHLVYNSLSQAKNNQFNFQTKG